MLLPKRHVPNALSLSRIPFLFLVTVLLFVDVPYRYSWALVCFVIASITDFLDGHMARRYKVVSSFGAMFDSLSDKILVLGIFISFLALGIYPPWFTFPVLVVLSREFIISGLRMLAAKKQIILHAEKGGKIKTAVQMIAVSGTLAALAIPEWKGVLGVEDGAVAPESWFFEKMSFYLAKIHVDVSGQSWILLACYALRRLSEVAFLISSVLAFTSGYGYCRRYGYLMLDDAKIPEGAEKADGPESSGAREPEAARTN